MRWASQISFDITSVMTSLGNPDWHGCAQPTSEFLKAYSKGLHKSKYWDPVYEDSLNLIAKLPAIAAHIYRSTYRGGKHIEADPHLDWAANLSHMMGALMRLYPISLYAPGLRAPLVSDHFTHRPQTFTLVHTHLLRSLGA